MSPRRPIHALDVVFVVLIVLLGFLAFFIGFLVAPLIVMALAYLVLLILDRRHHQTRLRHSSEQRQTTPAGSGRPGSDTSEQPDTQGQP
ncbi:MAG TPA: hypothetical protein VMU55_05420 [Solirubrobacteraceae bacterium]|nr:hypothetical protein [Solirubrobacteraceae bacterium]